MSDWKNDKELMDLVKSTLYTPVVGDILDAMGYYHQFLPQEIQPIRESDLIVGRAMPVVMADVYGLQVEPFGRLTQALDQINEGEVYLASGGNMRCAYWGELLTATVKTRGAAGAIINGYHRDTPKVLEQNWPVFSRGRYAQDSSVRTKVIDYRCPIEIAGTWINPGDIIFADIDGVLVIPQAVENEVFERAFEKSRTEKIVRKAIENGMSSTEAFRKFGIL